MDRSLIAPDHAEHGSLGTETDQVGGHVARPTHQVTLGTLLEHQDGSLGRHPTGIAIDVAIEDQVTDDEDLRRPQVAQNAGKSLHREVAGL